MKIEIKATLEEMGSNDLLKDTVGGATVVVKVVYEREEVE